MSKFNTGSDLDIEKTQKGFAVFNARVGIHGANDAWAIELWGQNLFDKKYNAEYSTGGFLFKAEPRQLGIELTRRF